MKAKFAYYIEFAFLFILLLLGGIFLLNRIQPEGFSVGAYTTLLSSMAFISLAVYVAVSISHSGTEKNRGIVLLAAIGGKFVAYLFVILFFLIDGKNLSVAFIIAFFVLYLLLTFSLIRGLLKLLNTN